MPGPVHVYIACWAKAVPANRAVAMMPAAIVFLVTVVDSLLCAGQLAFELAVAIEQDPAILVGDRADHVHRIAVADIGPGLERALVVERRGERAIRPALL